MAEFVVPEYLAESVRADTGAVSREWLGRLPAIVAELAQRWSLRLGAPYEPGGYCSWVAPVQGADGQRLVLKVAWRHDEAESEADGLRTWNGCGAVLLLDAHAEADTSALLLERCEPGTTLGSSVPEPEHAYDCVQHMLNCDIRLAEDPAGLAERMASLLDLDNERVTQWLLARCVQESIDKPRLAAVAASLAST